MAWVPGQPGPPGQPGQLRPPSAAPSGASSTVKTAVGLTMLAIVLCLLEAVLAVYILQESLADAPHMDADDRTTFRTVWGTLLGANLVISMGLAGGSVLALRRNVGGKVLIWVFGSIATVLRCGCGGFSGILLYIYSSGEADSSDLPFPVSVWGTLIAIESIALLAILAAMVALMLKGASFKNTSASRPGGPAGDGLPHIPPAPGWPG